jgi:hypothetical protein
METTTKPAPNHAELHERIAAVERRLEHRRARLIEDARESTHAASQAATKVIPIAAALGAGLVALYLTRRRSPSARYPRNDYDTYDRSAGTRRGVRWASIAGIIGTAIRIGTSPQVRAIIQHLRERRHGY